MCAAGFYHNDETKMVTPYRHFNTWMGDPVRVLLSANQNMMIERDGLLKNVHEASSVLRTGLMKLSAEFPEYVANVRGVGTFLAFDTANTAHRDALVGAMRANGVNTGGCGPASMRLRPSLYFTDKHADIYLEILSKSLAELS